jgi:hypothetical protein
MAEKHEEASADGKALVKKLQGVGGVSMGVGPFLRSDPHLTRPFLGKPKVRGLEGRIFWK